MIVVSGVLVLVALIFLIIGLLGDGLTMIWLSIGTSVVAGVFLLLGALQRRGAPAPVADSGPTGGDMLERVTAVSVRPRETEAPAAPVAEAPTTALPAAAAAGGQVSVVPGRPRYHVGSCRFLAGRPDVEQIDVDDARAEGYTACGVCKPDAALEAASAPVEPEPTPEPVMDEKPVEAAKPAKKTAARTAAATKAAPAKATAATKAAPAKAASKAAPAKAATKAAPAKAAAAKAAPAKAAAGSVVVIPDRGKYHNDACRFVKDVPGTVTLTKAAAKKQGYVACGVCKPG